MSKTIHTLTYSLILSAAAVCFWACEDDPFDKYGGEISEGMTVANITASYEPFAEETPGSRAWPVAGNALSKVSDMSLVAYDKAGNLMADFPMELTDIRPTDEDRTDADASNGTSAESQTACVKKNGVTIPFGEYYLVAVANIGHYSKAADGTISATKTTQQVLEELAADGSISTLDALRKLHVDWTKDNIANNRQMFGFFTPATAKQVPNSGTQFTTVLINKPNLDLHCWMRRVASKITVDFDGSALHDNISVYIKDVKIYNIASHATLGFGKQPVENGSYEIYNFTAKEEADIYKGVNDAHVINLGTGDDWQKWPRIANGSPYIEETDANGEYNGVKKDLHSETANALFFFENMQGDCKEANGVVKNPVLNLETGGASGTDYDGFPLGTYIEVEAYYKSNASEHIGSGPIKYRFMIGKDAVSDCNAERNHHYKLTLKLRGYANEYDWHIDYKQTPGFEAPNPWYVSYLYNHDSMMPFKYTLTDEDAEAGWELESMEAEIIQNPWSADDPANAGLDPNIATNVTYPYHPNNPYNPNYTEPSNPFYPDGDDRASYTYKGNKEVGNGFLSLRATTDIIISATDCGLENEDSYKYSDDKNSKEANNKYFKGVTGKGLIDRSKRTYVTNGTHDNKSGREEYSVTRKDYTYSFNVPVFTRAKVLIKRSGYSGNNPYDRFTRTAIIKLTPHLKKTDGSTKTASTYFIPVQQVRRIVNPKGVWRKEGNNAPFHVTMMELKGKEATNFTPVVSDGPWMAEIIGDKNFITLNGQQKVSGGTNSEIDFTIRFNGLSIGANPRNAVVRVLYNNYTCTHLIFVRQGYAPQAICETAIQYNGNTTAGQESEFYHEVVPGVKWSSFNMIYRGLKATDPRDEGSMFRYGLSNNPIDVFDNIYERNNTTGEGDCHERRSPGEFVNQAPFRRINSKGEFILNANGTPATQAYPTTATPYKSTTPDNGFNATGDENLATMRDYEQLYATPNIQHGFGVLYADGATYTQTEINQAYGYYRRSGDNTRGMRGLFCYYWDRENPNHPYTARNIFFPIGRSGYGHRKTNANESNNPNGKVEGVLRYCANGSNIRSSLFMYTGPLFSALYFRPGAVYYAKHKTFGGLIYDGSCNLNRANGGTGAITGSMIGLDINYFSFDVNTIEGTNLNNGNNAAFLRSVER